MNRASDTTSVVKTRKLGSAFLLCFLVVGCTGGDAGVQPHQQYKEIIAHARAGKLTAACDAWLPASYARELDEVLAQIGELIDREEYEAFRRVLVAAGKKLSAVLAFAGGDDRMLSLLGAKLKEIPRVLGIDTYERFQKLSVAKLLGALEAGVFREIMQLESVQEKLGSVTVELKERKRDWARLLLKSSSADGEVVEEEVDLIRHEGRWVPDEWVTDWPVTMRAWKERIKSAMTLKLESPEAFKKSLEAVREAVENPLALHRLLPKLNEKLGLRKKESK